MHTKEDEGKVKQNIDYLQFLTTHRKVNVKEELA
jgi:hypothetical protein